MFEGSASALKIANEIGRVEFDVVIFSIITPKCISRYTYNVLTFCKNPRKKMVSKSES